MDASERIAKHLDDIDTRLWFIMMAMILIAPNQCRNAGNAREQGLQAAAAERQAGALEQIAASMEWGPCAPCVATTEPREEK